MHVVEMQVEDFMRVKAVTIRPNGQLVELSGDNDSGKSSTLMALVTALGGAKHAPDDPVRHGAEVARIRLDLGELLIVWDCKAGGKPRLKVTTPDGMMEPRRPQELLDGLFSRLTFDPLAFFGMKPAEQSKVLADLMGLSEVMSSEATKRKALFDERTNVNRDEKKLRAQVEAIPFEAVQPEDTQALMAELEVIEAHNKGVEDKAARIFRAESQASARSKAAQERRAAAAKLIAEAEGLEAEAKSLLMSVHEMRAEQMDAIDDSEIRARIKNAGEVNARAARQAERVALHEKAEALARTAETLTEQIMEIDNGVQAKIQATPFPVERLSFGEDAVLYNGVLLSQASTAQQIRVSCAIARALNPKLNIVLIRHGSLVGKKMRDLILSDPGMEGYQVWIETVDTSGLKGFYLEDGEVVSIDGVPVVKEGASDE